MKLSMNFFKGKEIIPFLASWITLLNIILSEMSQCEKNKYCNVFTYRQNFNLIKSIVCLGLESRWNSKMLTIGANIRLWNEIGSGHLLYWHELTMLDWFVWNFYDSMLSTHTHLWCGKGYVHSFNSGNHYTICMHFKQIIKNVQLVYSQFGF